MKNFTLDQWIEWQCNLHPTNMDFNLSRMKEVAEQLNIFPIKPKVFTVAGTNGKGSTVAILESILVESGYNVGSYTSPHLLDFNERIKINKINSSTKEICKAFEKIEKIRKDITLTFFEFSTLAAFIIFSEKDLDVLVLEVGLGGRLDAVNIIEPDVSIITNKQVNLYLSLMIEIFEYIKPNKIILKNPSNYLKINILQDIDLKNKNILFD